jgi:hypothetical protein
MCGNGKCNEATTRRKAYLAAQACEKLGLRNCYVVERKNDIPTANLCGLQECVLNTGTRS